MNNRVRNARIIISLQSSKLIAITKALRAKLGKRFGATKINMLHSVWVGATKIIFQVLKFPSALLEISTHSV